MQEYCFTLTFQLPSAAHDVDQLIEQLAAAGCDDALVGSGVAGKLALEFTRSAATARQALFSAVRDVNAAIPGVRLTEAAPDFVGLTDVAEIIGVSRQNMRKLMLAHSPAFPLPVHEGKASIWHLADVLAWLNGRGHYRVPEAVQEVAQVTLRLNLQQAVAHYGISSSDTLE